jgi:hypothetical protein
VEFYAGRNRAWSALRLPYSRRIAAQERNAVAYGSAAVGHEIQVVRRILAAHRLRADLAVFLVLEDHHLERVTQPHAVLRQRVRNLDCTHRSDLTVVVATFRHRIDVRSSHQHGQRRVTAVAPADNVAGRVGAHVE